MNPHPQPYRFRGTALRNGSEISGINEIHCRHLSAFLGSPLPQKSNERRFLWGRDPTQRRNHLFSMMQLYSLRVSFSCPVTEQPQNLKVSVFQIHGRTERPFYGQRFFSFIADPDAPGNDIFFCKYRIKQGNAQVQNRIFQFHCQGLNRLLIPKRRWKSREFRLPEFHPRVPVQKFTGTHSLFISYLQSRCAEVSYPSRRIFKGKDREHPCLLPFQIGAGGRHLEETKMLFRIHMFDPFAIVEMSQMTVFRNRHHVGGMVGFQMNGFFPFIDCDRH